MTLADLATFVGTKIGMTDSATLTKIKTWAAQRYASMYAGALWKDALSIYSFAVAANQHTVILPHHVSQFLAAKYDYERLIPVDAAFLFASNPELWDSAGSPTHCSELAAIATKIQIPTPSQLYVYGSSSADETKTLRIQGEDANGNPLSETLTLIATGPTSQAATSGVFAVVHNWTKGGTVGQVELKDTASPTPNLLQTLKAAEKQKLHRRVRLHATPPNAMTLLVLAKRHPGPFTDDNDATTLPAQCDQALQALVHGDALEWQQQYGKAQAKFAEGVALLEAAYRTELYQAANAYRLTPGDPLAEGCSPQDWL